VRVFLSVDVFGGLCLVLLRVILSSFASIIRVQYRGMAGWLPASCGGFCFGSTSPAAALRCGSLHLAGFFLNFCSVHFVNSLDFCGFLLRRAMAGYLNDDLEDLEDDYVDFDGFGVSGSSGGDPSNPVCMVNTLSIIKAHRAFCNHGIKWTVK
jgi:hypothetical protein